MRACGAKPRQLPAPTGAQRTDPGPEGQDRRDRACASALRLPARARPAAQRLPWRQSQAGVPALQSGQSGGSQAQEGQAPRDGAHAPKHRPTHQRGVEHGLRQRQPGQWPAHQVPDRGR